MELFRKSIMVKLSSSKDKFLVAEDDQENVCQDKDGSLKNAIWAVEFDKGGKHLRFKSCYGKYLTASDSLFLPGTTRKKVLQTNPKKNDTSILWEPIRDGFSVRLKTPSGQFLRPHGGVPPWRNAVTHDVPRKMGTQEKILWDVETVEALPKTPLPIPSPSTKNLIRQSSGVNFPIERETPTLAIVPASKMNK